MMPGRRGHLARALIAAVVILGPIFPSSVMAESSESAARPANQAPHLAAYAEHYGLTIEQAQKEWDLFDDASDVEQRATAELGEGFAGLWIAHEPSFHVVVAIVGGRASSVESLVRGTPLQDLVEVAPAQRSVGQLNAIADATRNHLGDVVDIDVDLPANEVVVTTLDEARTIDSLQRANRDNGVLVREVSELSRPTADIYGGLPLNGDTICTSGFAVVNGSGTTGIATAGHCPNSLTYSGTSLPYVAARVYNTVDAQWHTTPGLTDLGKVKTGSSSTQDITGQHTWSSLTVGSWLCKYGRTTGYGCGELTTKSFSPSWIPKGGSFGRVTNCSVDLSVGGDSGGPVFQGPTAAGIISGNYSDIFCAKKQAIFGIMGYVTDWLGVRVF